MREREREPNVGWAGFVTCHMCDSGQIWPKLWVSSALLVVLGGRLNDGRWKEPIDQLPPAPHIALAAIADVALGVRVKDGMRGVNARWFPWMEPFHR